MILRQFPFFDQRVSARWKRFRENAGTRRVSTRRVMGIGLTHVLVIVVGILVGFPFFYMMTTSFKTLGEVYTVPMQWLPARWDFENFLTAWNGVPFARFAANSLFYTTLVTVGEFLMGLTAGYAFGRLNFPKKDLIFFFVLLTMMIPLQITIIPRFLMLKDLGWINTFQGLIVPMLSSAFATFLFREHFKSLPDEVFDAAKIDGAGYLRQLLEIALPMSVPIATTLFLLAFVAHWNEYLWPLIVTNTKDMQTLPVGLQALRLLGGDLPQWHVVMAGATMVVLPLVIIFLIGQERFFEGASQGAIKG
jgi:ABC-type glycerol-3-phosphate transport system permease component